MKHLDDERFKNYHFDVTGDWFLKNQQKIKIYVDVFNIITNVCKIEKNSRFRFPWVATVYNESIGKELFN